MEEFLARFLAGFGEEDSEGKEREEVEEFQLPKMILKVPETGRRVPKIWFLAFWGNFWQDFWHFEVSFWQITLVRLLESL